MQVLKWKIFYFCLIIKSNSELIILIKPFYFDRISDSNWHVHGKLLKLKFCHLFYFLCFSQFSFLPPPPLLSLSLCFSFSYLILYSFSFSFILFFTSFSSLFSFFLVLHLFFFPSLTPICWFFFFLPFLFRFFFFSLFIFLSFPVCFIMFFFCWNIMISKFKPDSIVPNIKAILVFFWHLLSRNSHFTSFFFNCLNLPSVSHQKRNVE